MSRTGRRGVGALWALLVLTLFGLLAAAAAGQFAAVRRSSDARERRLQALWLARSGVELAVARVAAGTDQNPGEDVTVIPGGVVRLSWGKGPGDVVRVRSEARYTPPASPMTPVTETLTRAVRRAGGRVEVVDDPAK